MISQAMLRTLLGVLLGFQLALVTSVSVGSAQSPPPATDIDEPATGEKTDEKADEKADTLPEDTHLRIDLAPTEITVGDVVQATLILEWPAGAPDVNPRFPAWQTTWGDAEILATSKVERLRGTRGQTLFTQTLSLTAFRTGELNLPPVQIALPLGGSTVAVATPDDLRLTVASVLPEGEDTPSPEAAVAPRALPVGSRFWWTTSILTALCMVTAVAVARRHPTAFGGLLATPRLPPFDELRARLRSIRPASGSDRGHTQISLALRTYLGRATGVQAVERTTSEIRRLLRHAPLTPDVIQRIITLLQRCDEAKFIGGLDVPAETVQLRVTEAEAIARVIHQSQRSEEEEGEESEEEGIPQHPPARRVGS